MHILDKRVLAVYVVSMYAIAYILGWHPIFRLEKHLGVDTKIPPPGVGAFARLLSGPAEKRTPTQHMRRKRRLGRKKPLNQLESFRDAESVCNSATGASAQPDQAPRAASDFLPRHRPARGVPSGGGQTQPAFTSEGAVG